MTEDEHRHLPIKGMCLDLISRGWGQALLLFGVHIVIAQRCNYE